MLKALIATLVLAVAGCIPAVAQVYTPEKGSAERTEILNTLRVPVENDYKQKIVFSVDTLRVRGQWAFLNGAAQTADGGQPDLAGTKFAELQENGVYDNNFQALLRRTGKKWKVVKYQVSCTDVCYLDWWKRYRAPKMIFPGTE